jgi:hypothetical protein
LRFLTKKSTEGFEAFTAVVMKSIMFWDMTPCSPLSSNRRFGGPYLLHFQGQRKIQQNNEQAICLLVALLDFSSTLKM